MRVLSTVKVAVLSGLFFSLPALAAEGGMGVYLLGMVGPQAGYLPDPGTYGRYDHYQYEAWARKTQSLSAMRSATLNHAGPGGGRLSVTATAATDLKARVSVKTAADIVTAIHVFDADVLGGHPAVVLTVPYVNADMDVDMSADAVADVTLSTARGRSYARGRSFSRDGNVSLGTDNIGDAILGSVIGWHDGRFHYTAGMNLYMPTGEYHVKDSVNAGRNYWAIEPTAAFTYLNEQNGREFSAALGWTFNDENSATHYDTGDELHLEWAAIQHLSQYAYIGLAGYAYQQTSEDSGRGATLGAFKGEVLAAGPVVGVTLPLSKDHNLMLNARYYDEFETENRLEGDALFLTAIVDF